MCIFCIINLVYIIIARFKAQHKSSSNVVVNIFVVYFLIFSLTIPEMIGWLITSFESLQNKIITGDKGILSIVEMMYDFLRGLALLLEQLYIFWCIWRLKKAKTNIKKLETCSKVGNDTVKYNRFDLIKE